MRNVVTAELCAIEKQLVVFTRVTVGIERGERGGGGVGGIDPAEHHPALIDFGRRGYAVYIAAALGERVIELVGQRGRLIHRHERDMLHASVEIIRRRSDHSDRVGRAVGAGAKHSARHGQRHQPDAVAGTVGAWRIRDKKRIHVGRRAEHEGVGGRQVGAVDGHGQLACVIRRPAPKRHNQPARDDAVACRQDKGDCIGVRHGGDRSL